MWPAPNCCKLIPVSTSAGKISSKFRRLTTPQAEVECDIDKGLSPHQYLKQHQVKQHQVVIGHLTETKEAIAQMLVKNPVLTVNII